MAAVGSARRIHLDETEVSFKLDQKKYQFHTYNILKIDEVVSSKFPRNVYNIFMTLGALQVGISSIKACEKAIFEAKPNHRAKLLGFLKTALHITIIATAILLLTIPTALSAAASGYLVLGLGVAAALFHFFYTLHSINQTFPKDPMNKKQSGRFFNQCLAIFLTGPFLPLYEVFTRYDRQRKISEPQISMYEEKFMANFIEIGKYCETQLGKLLDSLKQEGKSTPDELALLDALDKLDIWYKNINGLASKT